MKTELIPEAQSMNSSRAEVDLNCRLCGGDIVEVFHSLVLQSHDVRYFKCRECGSLQTEIPTWLGEAYSKSGVLIEADTGAALRNLDNYAVVYWAARVLGIPRHASVLDYGGGTGFLCRLLRDAGYDAWMQDAYSDAHYSRKFTNPIGTFDIVCSFEVFEHFPNPALDTEEVLGRTKQLCVVGTETYENQGPDWWYLSGNVGQHVFFYSEKGMRFLAKRFGFNYSKIGNYNFFLRKPITRFQYRLLSHILSSRLSRLYRATATLRLNYAAAVADSGLFPQRSE